jgi:MFS superfamily sulfate permease-like transporter
MDRMVVLTPAVSLLPIAALVGVIIFGLLFLSGGNKTSRKVALPLLLMLALVLALAWLRGL